MKLFGYYKDGAILQRNQPVCLRGRADGEVFVTLVGGEIRREGSAVAENGKFTVCLEGVEDTHSLFALCVRCGEEELSIQVRFGDVYLALGQSNMSYCLSAVEDWEAWQTRASKADVAFLNVGEGYVNEAGEVLRPAQPQEELAADYAWVTGKQKEVVSTSAICVQTATLLSEKEGIPVAFVQTAMGGLSVDAYVPREAIEADEEVVRLLKEEERYIPLEKYNQVGLRNFTQLSGVWNEKIAPLRGVSFKGIVWYLGESSAFDLSYADCFLRIMKILRKEYEKAFGDIPFVAVQIAPEYYPYGDKYGYLYVNEAIARLEEETGAICIPTYDIEPRWQKGDGDLYFHPIHPTNKAPVSERVADSLRGVRTAFPRIEEVDYQEGKAICKVANAGKGLRLGKCNGFTLAGENGKYYPAQAEVIDESHILVYSVDVEHPERLTYAFMQYQDFCNVKTADGAPLLPYRSVVEPVTEAYCFPPAYTVNGGLQVYENNFGWQIGTCRKADIWKRGSIYTAAEVEIVSENGEICISSTPTAKDYFLFGVSPALCLAGHKHHLQDYEYCNLSLKADTAAELLGMIVRVGNGELYRFDLLNGEKTADSLPLTKEYARYTFRLSTGMRGDSAPVELEKSLREQIVEGEILFRSMGTVKVYCKDILLSDRSFSVERTEGTEKEEIRLDIRLPESR